MKDMRAVRFNEKVKRASTVGSNGALALFVAAISRWFVFGLDLSTGLWIFISAGLMFVSVQINDLLDSEEV